MPSGSAKTARSLQRSEFSFRANSGETGKPRYERHRSHGPVFRPGDPILESGIYEVIHDNAHRSAHEVVLISRDSFPTCDTCFARVRFRLVRTAPYIFQDVDFEESE